MTAADDDAQAAWRRDYFRNVRPDLDPQSWTSKTLEFFGADEPYRNDSGSYDYRQKKWDQSVSDGNPDISWSLPVIPDDAVYSIAVGTERALGNWNIPVMVGAVDPIQEKMHPFPDSWMGKRERPGNAASGSLAHALQQWEWLSPYSATDILSAIGPDSPETVQRDIDAWKGGSSAIDRTIGGIAGVDMGEKSTNPYVDPVEIGSLGAMFAVPASAARKAKQVERQARRAARKAPPPQAREVTASAQSRAPYDAPSPKPDQKPKPRAAPQEPGDVRRDIEEAFRRRRK